ncbi:DMT family transporter [Metabacillus herbersteinensis]|uniref:DMT family transporter n=1 Tax=Metabacillus herbersteinensis TaxID=283816 RepID=A0ABV6GBK7_9BACI
MNWFFLVAAGLFEVVGVTGISKFNEKKSLTSFLFMTMGFGASFLFLTQAMETISMGTAYAVWTGIGTAGSAIIGILFLGEKKEWKRIAFITLIISSTIGLKLVS